MVLKQSVEKRLFGVFSNHHLSTKCCSPRRPALAVGVNDMWPQHLTPDTWQLTTDNWHMTTDIWHLFFFVAFSLFLIKMGWELLLLHAKRFRVSCMGNFFFTKSGGTLVMLARTEGEKKLQHYQQNNWMQHKRLLIELLKVDNIHISNHFESLWVTLSHFESPWVDLSH